MDSQPTFPEFSRQIQEILDEYDAVFIKTNWSTPAVNYFLLCIPILQLNRLFWKGCSF